MMLSCTVHSLHSFLFNNIKLQGAQGDRGEEGDQGEAGLLVGESVVEDNKLLVINQTMITVY